MQDKFEYYIKKNAFIDTNGDPLSYSSRLANQQPLPDWLSFFSSIRKFQGVPDNSDLYEVCLNFTEASVN